MNDSSIRKLTLRMRMFGIGGKEIDYLDLAGIFLLCLFMKKINGVLLF